MLVHVERISSFCAFCEANFEGFETKTLGILPRKTSACVDNLNTNN